jgi:hypothetical protein
MPYLKEENYRKLVNLLLTAGDDFDPESRVIELLGEIGDVWPESILAENERDRLKTSVHALTDLFVELSLNTFTLDGKSSDAVRAAIHRVLTNLPADLTAAVKAEIDRDAEEAVQALGAEAA